jgi:hypothetical protein
MTVMKSVEFVRVPHATQGKYETVLGITELWPNSISEQVEQEL